MTAERAAITQALFDYLATSKNVSRDVSVAVGKVVVSPIAIRLSRAHGYYQRFAEAIIYDKNGQAGIATVLLGYFVDRVPGWRVLDLGSAEIGCKIPQSVFRGRKTAVLNSLGLGCP